MAFILFRNYQSEVGGGGERDPDLVTFFRVVEILDLYNNNNNNNCTQVRFIESPLHAPIVQHYCMP